MPRSILRISIRNFNDPHALTHTLIYVAWCFPHIYSGLYWSVGNNYTSVGACRLLLPFIPRLLPVSGHVPFATTATKNANITRYSHIPPWNAYWVSRTTVRLRWTASTYEDCVPVNHTTMLVWSLPLHLHQAIPQSSSPSPALFATILPKYDISILPHPSTTTINSYFPGTEVRLVPTAADEGGVASKTENSSAWYVITGTWCIIGVLPCCCCKRLSQQHISTAVQVESTTHSADQADIL